MRFTNRFLSAPLAFACASVAFVAGSAPGLHAQTIIYRRGIKMPLHLAEVVYQRLNDSGLGATDLDVQMPDEWRHRFIVANNRLWMMQENGDGTATFGTTRQSDIQNTLASCFERHVNTNPRLQSPVREVLFGAIGAGNRYNEVSPQGQAVERWPTSLPTARSLSAGGAAGISIAATADDWNLNGTNTRLADINRNTRQVTPFFGNALQETGKAMGGDISQALGADGNLYVLDYENLRILALDTGASGGSRGAFLGTFDLDPTKTAINSMTVDLAGNFYVGDGKGGFDMYGQSGQWKRGFHNTYVPDPNANGFYSDGTNYPARCYMNYYASGLNDGNGTLDIYDDTGYRQYTILGATAAPVAYAAWEAQYFSAAQQTDPAVSDPTAAPQGDGVSNLLKYVFNINPAQPMTAADSAALPAVAVTTSNGAQWLSLTYRQYASLSGVSVNVQTSPDLVTWTTVASPTVLSNGIDPVTGDPVIQVGVPLDGSREFIRLSVTQPQPRLRAGVRNEFAPPAPLSARHRTQLPGSS